MPRKFDDNERNIIRDKLLRAGREWFGRIGLKKTSVEDLTKEAGIAQGSFYLFFSSKEELFFEIMQEEERNIRQKALQKLLTEEKTTTETVRDFVKDAFQVMDRSPLLRRIYTDGILDVIVRKLPKEKLMQNFEQDTDALLPVVLKWQSEGLLVQADPELIVSLFRSILLISLHKKEIGEDLYDATIDFLSDTIARGLTK